MGCAAVAVEVTASAAVSKSKFFILKGLRRACGPRNHEGLRIGPAAAKHRDEMEPSSDLEETMRFDPAEGIADLDDHLNRLKRSADERGFKFDRHAARNELQAATFGKNRAATARMVLSPSGAMAIEVKAPD